MTVSTFCPHRISIVTGHYGTGKTEFSVNLAMALAAEGTLADRILPIETALAAYPAITVSAPQAGRFRNGGALDLVRLKATVTGPVRVYDPEGVCIALGVPEDGQLKMDCLLQV